MISELLAIAPDWAIRHAAVLVVIVPLMLSPLCVALPNGRLAWVLTLIGAASSVFFASILAAQALSGTIISYELGGWAPPVGIEFRVDGLNAAVILLVSIIGLLASIFSWPTVVSEVIEEKRAMFYAAFLLCFGGLIGVGCTGDAFNLFVFLEISSISTYVLVALGARQDRRALPAAFNYLIMGTIGATFYVIGVGFLYAATGTLNMADIAARLPELQDSRVVQAGFAFIIAGIGMKVAMWPLHQWLPSAYAYAPSVVTVFLSATATKIAFYALLRMMFTVYSPDMDFVAAAFVWVIAPAAAVAALACSFQAVFQTDVKRMLAYSSVAQVGYMLIAVSVGTAAGLSAGYFHLINHALMKGALFMGVAVVAMRVGGTTLDDFNGVARKAPWTMTAMAIAGLSLVGVPLTAGFLSKVAIFNAALSEGLWWAAVVIAGASVLAVIYIGRVLERAFFQPPLPGRSEIKEAPFLILLPIWVLALANIVFGINPGFILDLTGQAALAAFQGGVQ